MRLLMKSLLFLKKYIGGIFLFFFLFSSNVLLYSTHFVEEFGHDDHKIANHSSNSDSSISPAILVANHQHDGDQGAHHEDGESCCDSHSHASILYQPISYKHSPRLISQLTGEPFRFIPVVYLDKFIPPAEPRLRS
jgi:hypothetical protein